MEEDNGYRHEDNNDYEAKKCDNEATSNKINKSCQYLQIDKTMLVSWL